jgi:hypothetical protein
VRQCIEEVGKWIYQGCVSEHVRVVRVSMSVVGATLLELWKSECMLISSKYISNFWIYRIIHKLQYIIHALQLHYSKNSVILSVNYQCILVGYWKQLGGILHYLMLLVLWEVAVGRIAYGRFHVIEYVFPDIHIISAFKSLILSQSVLSYRLLTFFHWRHSQVVHSRTWMSHLTRFHSVCLTCRWVNSMLNVFMAV